MQILYSPNTAAKPERLDWSGWIKIRSQSSMSLQLWIQGDVVPVSSMQARRLSYYTLQHSARKAVIGIENVKTSHDCRKVCGFNCMYLHCKRGCV